MMSYITEDIHTCQHEGCTNEGMSCWLSGHDWQDTDEPDYWYCGEHIQQEGFCWGCGQFWAGVEDFEFSSNGLCSDCRHNSDVTGEYADDDRDER